MINIEFSHLTQIAFGYWNSMVLYALNQIRIFDILHERKLNLDQILELISMDRHALQSLLNAGVASKLLEKKGDDYTNTTLSDRYLVTESATSLVHWVNVMNRWISPWMNISEYVKNGNQIENESSRLGEDPGYMCNFILGMHEYASISSSAIENSVDLSNCDTLLDIGGGAGTFTILLCNKFKKLKGIILDLKPVLAVSGKVIKENGLSDRIRTMVGDYTKDDFTKNVDAILLSNILHQESPDMCGSILKRSYEALSHNGILIVQGYFLNENKTSPLFTTMHNLSAGILWNSGQSYTLNEMEAMINQNGFIKIEMLHNSSSGFSIIKAIK